MDYNGIKLICNWINDAEGQSETESILSCRLKMLEVLDKMAIKNKTIVDECKLLDTVKRWAEVFSSPAKKDVNEESVSEWILNEIDQLVNKSVDLANNKSSTASTASKLKAKSIEMYDEWSNLKQSFKIPKKQRIEERIEHERELNSSSDNISPDINSNQASFNEKNFKDRRFKSKINFWLLLDKKFFYLSVKTRAHDNKLAMSNFY